MTTSHHHPRTRTRRHAALALAIAAGILLGAIAQLLASDASAHTSTAPTMRERQAHATMHACATTTRPLPLVARSVRVKGQRASTHQRVVITRVLNTGRAHRAPRQVQLAALVAITQESGARNLRYGHGSSVGVLQLISLHGSRAWRLVITNSAGWFYRGARQVNTRQAPGAIAQAVQRSAHPGAYAQWTSEARRTYATFMRPCAR